MLKEALRAGANSWLLLTGESATYRDTITGIRSTVTATLEQDVQTVDDFGLVTSGNIVSMSPEDISLPARGDEIAFITQGTYRVDELLDSPGFLTRVFVSKI